MAKKIDRFSKNFVVGIDSRKWKFENDQIYKIKDKDKNAVSKFFQDNYKNFYDIAKKLHYFNKRISIDDIIVQFFIDLPYFRYDSESNLLIDLKNSFEALKYGGVLCKPIQAHFESSKCNISIDNYDENETNTSHLLDYFYSTKSLEETFFAENEKSKQEKEEKILKYLENTFKNKKQLNYLYCRIFTNLSKKEITGNEYEEYKQFIKQSNKK